MADKKITLMYHSIVDEHHPVPENREVGAELYDVTLGNFKRQIAFLKERHFVTGDNIDVGKCDPVTITFDDGESNNYTAAYPVLKANGVTAYFFIIAGRVGLEGYMALDQIIDLHNNGMIIGSHGMTHRVLTKLTDEEILFEFSASRKILETLIGSSCDCLSIPRGFCNAKIVKLAESAGYRKIFISRRTGDIPERCIERVSIKKTFNIDRFNLLLKGTIPLKERIANIIKNSIKAMFGSRIYDGLRTGLLKFSDIIKPQKKSL